MVFSVSITTDIKGSSRLEIDILISSPITRRSLLGPVLMGKTKYCPMEAENWVLYNALKQ
jgi:hypothetical protein